MKYIANTEIGDYKKGEEVPKEKAEIWINAYKYPPVDKVEDSEFPNSPKKKEDELSPEAKEKLKDIKADLKDDGKLNYSHDPKRRSPGRKKKPRRK